MTINDLRVLVDNLDEYIHIPGGIERLRKTVLHLAISGQLVPQISSEGTGEELYRQIQAEKAKLPKKQKELPEITNDEIPFAIPTSWRWVRLGELFLFINGDRGKNYPSKDKLSAVGEIPFFSAIDLQANKIAEDQLLYLSQYQFSSLGSGKVKLDDLIICIRGSLGKHAISNYNIGAIASSLVILRNVTTVLDLARYASIYLDTGLFVSEVKKYDNGTAQPNLSADSLKKFAFPLPPLSEQKRAVEKVNEIFALIGELDKKYKAEEAERSKFVRSSLRALPHDKSTLALDNLARIIKTKADAAELRKAILHLAVSGRLVPQIPSEGTGEELYKQVQTVISTKNALHEITEKEIPFHIPDTWKWVRFGDLGRFGSGSTPVRGENKYYDGGINWFKSGELTDSYMTVNSQETITETAFKECSLRMNHKGDMLIAMYGATAGKLGLLEVDGATNQAVCGVTLHEHVDRLFAYYWLLSTRDVLIAQSSGAAQPNISKMKIVNHCFGLPPLAEQKRIVHKTTELLDLVAELEKHLEQ
jgi:type I restriction enzyme S subunit